MWERSIKSIFLTNIQVVFWEHTFNAAIVQKKKIKLFLEAFEKFFAELMHTHNPIFFAITCNW